MTRRGRGEVRKESSEQQKKIRYEKREVFIGSSSEVMAKTRKSRVWGKTLGKRRSREKRRKRVRWECKLLNSLEKNCAWTQERRGKCRRGLTCKKVTRF